jgi:hypothetical protein
MDTAARRLVATMPLHAITTTYGEDGLRERFAQEIGVFGHPRPAGPGRRPVRGDQ